MRILQCPFMKGVEINSTPFGCCIISPQYTVYKGKFIYSFVYKPPAELEEIIQP
jgi:hypothetical protein